MFRLRLTPLQWLICALAALAFAFDIYELLMLPLIVRPALVDLLGVAPGSPEINRWVGLLLYVPALCGGFFGLLGGYLTDRFGRRQVLVWSILLYAGSAFAAGFSTSAPMLLVLRSATFVGVCVEFVAGVAWLAELFSDPKQREAVLGWTQAFSSIGGLMVTGAYYLAVTYADSLPAIHGGHEAWRYTLISGVIPAIPLILVRPWLPESPRWLQQKVAGTLTRPSFGELFQPALRRTTVVTLVMMAASYALAFGALQHTPRIVPGLAEVKPLPRPEQEAVISATQGFQEVGGLVGRLLLAVLVVRIASQRQLLRIFQWPVLLLLPLIYWFAPGQNANFIQWGVFVGGLLTVAQFSFWGNYLPRVYPTHLRGTGESFAANVGGRMIGTAAALLTTNLATVMPGASPTVSLAHACAVVALLAGVIGAAACFWLPEPQQEDLPE